MRTIFSEIAEQSYFEILDFLSLTWTEKEVNRFVNDTEKIVNNLNAGNLLMFPETFNGIRSALTGKKHVRMFFRKIDEEQILILLFCDMRQNPHKIIDILK